MNGRIYDPVLARFLQADPFVDGVTNTQGYNRYSYVHTNPLNAIKSSPETKATQIIQVNAIFGVGVKTLINNK